MEIILLLFGLVLSDQVTISTISTKFDSVSGSMVGSYYGGSTLYIRGSGFDTTVSNNLVWVGTSICDTSPYGGSPTLIVCDTQANSDSVDNWQDITEQSLTIQVAGKQRVVCSSGNCKFSYQMYKTPTVHYAIPNAGYGNDVMNFYGIHRIKDLGDIRDFGDIRSLKIGQSICNRLDFSNDAISQHYYNVIGCKVAKEQEAGLYLIQQWVHPGKARISKTALFTDYYLKKDYHYKVLPLIKSISSNSGFSGGNILQITGTGFSQSQNMEVKASGHDCKILSASPTSIECQVEQLDPSKSIGTLEYSGSTPQQQGYILGTGFKYTRYDVRLSSQSFRTKLNNDQLSPYIEEQGYINSLFTQKNIVWKKCQFMRGYFKAPITASYTFYAIADDSQIVYLSTQGNTTKKQHLQKILWQPTHSTSNENFFKSIRDNQNAQNMKVVSLTQYTYYYMQVYHCDGGGDKFVRVGVQFESNDAIYKNKVYDVQQFKIESDYESQKIELIINNVKDGDQIKFSRIEIDNKYKVSYNYSQVIYNNQTVEDLKSKLESFQYFPTLVVTATPLDTTGNQVDPSSTDITGYKYSIQVDQYRDPTHLPQIKCDSGSCQITITRQHSDPLQGSFNLSIGGVAIQDIPFNIEAGKLQAKIQYALKCGVTVARYNEPQDGSSFLIGYSQCGSVGQLSGDASGISGGTAGAKSISTIYHKNASNNIFYTFIPSQFLYIPTTKPSVSVTVNGLLSSCKGTCDYQILSDQPIVSSFTKSGNTITISIDPKTATLEVNQLQVEFAGQLCTQITGTINSFTCNLAEYSDNSAKIQAGSHYPIVYYKSVGIIKRQASLTAQQIELTLGNLADSYSVYGGLEVPLTGSNLPLQKYQTKLYKPGEVQFKLCDIATEVSFKKGQQKMDIIIPARPQSVSDASCQLKVTYKGKQATTTINYDQSILPKITDISPKTSSPVLKKDITITGQNFGTDKALLSVWLMQKDTKTKKYELNVISATDDQIVAKLGGGRTGTYDLVVQKSGVGEGNSFSFEYLIKVTSVQNNQGSDAGGTRLTVKGENFSPVKNQNQVYIGGLQQINSFCQIQTVDTDSIPQTIQCLTPAKRDSFTQPQPIFVIGRLIEESNKDFKFTYKTEKTATLNTPSKLDLSWGQEVQLTGSFLDVNDVNKVKVLIGKQSITPTLVNNTNVHFTMNDKIKNGKHTLRVWLQDSGYAQGSYEISCILSLDPFSIRGSVLGGIFQLTGSGLPYTSVLIGPATKLVKKPICGQQNKCVDLSYTPENALTPKYSLSSTTLTADTIPTDWTVTSIKIKYKQTLLQCTFTVQSNNDIEIVCPTFEGEWQVVVLGNFGYAQVTGTIQNAQSNKNMENLDVGFNGYKGFIITGTNINEHQQIQVCGNKVTQITKVNSSAISIDIPMFASIASEQHFNILRQTKLNGKPFGDNQNKMQLPFDGDVGNNYYSTASQCFFGIDLGSQITKVLINKIRLFPLSSWVNVQSFLNGAKLQHSQDGNNWNQLKTFDGQVHSGWNYIKLQNPLKTRFVRFSHNKTSLCKIAELEVYGKLITQTSSAQTLQSTACDLSLQLIQGTPLTFNKITYKKDKTPIIQKIVPNYASIVGGQSIQIIGSGFTDNSTVLIGGKQCVKTTTQSSKIICTVPAKQKQSNLEMTVDGNVAINNGEFFYAEKWSQQATWGGQVLPRQGDVVYVPKGMTLVVDQTYVPKLKSVIVQGIIIFSDQLDIDFHTQMFLVQKGRFIAGTQKNPHSKKLTFTLYGGLYDKQLPIFGNKGIACYKCTFDLFGTPRTRTWTDISSTVSAGSDTLTLSQDVDWKVGQSIVIASTQYDYKQAEQRIIKSISGKTITVDIPFKYQHYSNTDTYNGQQMDIRAEVGLITRNIKVMGDQTSTKQKYGSHLMMVGKQQDGLNARIAYTEFTRCGQPRIVGRYCMHFHMNGDVTDSYVKGNAVHHSFARILTLHGIHYLHVSENVGYWVEGHNFFLEDGIQTHNVIEYNLAIATLQSFTMLQTDLSPASFWITNPSNTLRYNHAAGGQFYGFWYQIKNHPDGPSSSIDICPRGMKLGQTQHNVAHSYVRFGLRILQLATRQKPCQDIRNDLNVNPWQENPSSQSVFNNFTLYKNQECGFLGQVLGNVKISNFKVADNFKAGLQFHKTNLTEQKVYAQNILIVGNSQRHTGSENTRGIITSRTDGLHFKNIRFFNFNQDQTPLQSCSQCHDVMVWVTGGKATFFEDITYSNIKGNYIYWQVWKRQIFYDLDGSLTKPFQTSLSLDLPSATLTSYLVHNQVPDCKKDADGKWNGSLLCNQKVKVRKLVFTNYKDKIQFNGVPMKIYRMDGDTLSQNEDDYSQIDMIKIKQSVDLPFSHAAPFVTGRKYNVHFKEGIDFSHLAIQPSQYWTESQPGVIIRFNYTQQRELFQLGHLLAGKVDTNYFFQQTTPLDTQVCTFGQHTVDVDNRILQVCVSGKSMTPPTDWLDINGIKCRYLCPDDVLDAQKQPFIRLWSNVSQWPNEQLPKEGDNVTIKAPWTVILDINPPKINYLQVNGFLIFDQKLDQTILQAHYIWVRAGSIKIGSQDQSFKKKAKIILHGQQNDKTLTMGAKLSENKIIGVTGTLQFYGEQITKSWTKLKSNAAKGSKQISLISNTKWKVGDKIVIAPSFANKRQYETRTITQINGQTVKFEQELQYLHYGDSKQTLQTEYGNIDMRAGVGLLNRNIQITIAEGNDHGCQIYVFGNFDDRVRIGKIIFKGVQVSKCGQKDTQNSAINFQDIREVEQNSVIQKSSIHNCGGYCLFGLQMQKLIVTDTVFYYGQKFLTYLQTIKFVTYQNNLLIGARKRQEMEEILKASLLFDDVACFETYTEIDYQKDGVSVKNNLCQGSDKTGFVFPHVPCSQMQINSFINNTAGSTEVAFMLHKISKGECYGGSRMSGYGSLIGLMANPQGRNNIRYQNMVFVENKRGITLRFALNGIDNYGVFKNMYFSQMVRETCIQCYSDYKSYCRNSHAVRMLSVTIGGQKFPLLKIGNIGYDVICNEQSLDARAYMENIKFVNYKTKYANHPTCENNVVFKRHSLASDATAGHYLKNVQCVDCEQSVLGFFEMPNQNWRGWFGGCGQFDCTGPNNYLIHDQTGDFLGFKGQIIPNNTQIGDNTPQCTWVKQINGHICKSEDHAVLQYESIAPDFNSRKTWPINVSYDGGKWVTQTNAWRQWQWDGAQPLNLRLSRFLSIVKLHQVYNLTYASQPPSDSRYQIQKRVFEGIPTDWVIIKIYYPVPYTLSAMIDKQIVKSFRPDQEIDLKTKTEQCGANTYFFQNNTIHFVVNGKQSCVVRIKILNSIKVSTRLQMNVTDFLQQSVVSLFIDRIATFLGIDFSRVKVVGVRQGSTIVDYRILAELTTGQNDAVNESIKYDTVFNELSKLQQKLKEGIMNESIKILSDIAPVMDHNSQLNLYTPQPQKEEQQDQQKKTDQKQGNKNVVIYVAVGVSLAVLFIFVIIIAVCYYRHRKKIVEMQTNIEEFQCKQDQQVKPQNINLNSIIVKAKTLHGIAGDQSAVGQQGKQNYSLISQTSPYTKNKTPIGFMKKQIQQSEQEDQSIKMEREPYSKSKVMLVNQRYDPQIDTINISKRKKSQKMP